MEFPELLSAILYTDCSAQIEQEFPRLKALAQANGNNTALITTLNYFNQTKKSPTPEALKEYAPSQPRMSVERVEADIIPDLEQAADWRKAYPAGSFELAMSNSWYDANRNYVDTGYRTAVGIATGGMIPPDMKGYQFEKRMKGLYGDDEANWDRTAFSQLWLQEYLAANPFVKHEEEDIDPANEHERVLATGNYVDDDGEVVSAEFTIIKATDFTPKNIKWLWPDRIPQGKICWFTGKPKTGKSLALLDLIARITTGRDWPDGEKNLLPPQDVLLAVSEDTPDDTVIPRLNAVGADLSRVSFFHRIKVDDGSRQLQLNKHTSMLKRALEANPQVTVVILDPLESFAGDVNINSNQEIRPVMDALSAVCRKTGVTLIGIIHDNKRSDVSAIQKIPGGSAVSGAARSAWGFSRDPENRNECYMSLIAGNLSKKETGLKYTIGEATVNDIAAPRIVWGEEHDNTADDLLNAERDKSPSKDGAKLIGLAKEFLPAALANGPRRAPELISEAEEKGISVGALYRAKEQSSNILIVKRGETFAEQGRLSWWVLHREEPVMGDIL